MEIKNIKKFVWEEKLLKGPVKKVLIYSIERVGDRRLVQQLEHIKRITTQGPIFGCTPYVDVFQHSTPFPSSPDLLRFTVLIFYYILLFLSSFHGLSIISSPSNYYPNLDIISLFQSFLISTSVPMSRCPLPIHVLPPKSPYFLNAFMHVTTLPQPKFHCRSSSTYNGVTYQ